MRKPHLARYSKYLGLEVDETIANEVIMKEDIGPGEASDTLEACSGSCPDADVNALTQNEGLVNDIECIRLA